MYVSFNLMFYVIGLSLPLYILKFYMGFVKKYGRVNNSPPPSLLTLLKFYMGFVKNVLELVILAILV